MSSIKSLLIALGISALLSVPVTSTPPEWWAERGVTNAEPASNKSPANIGQAKWMAKNALEALREILPDTAALIEADLVGAGKPLSSWDPPTTPAERNAQHASLMIGQLKAISAPFYIHLKLVAPQWLASEMVYYGLPAGDFPWTVTTVDDANKAPAVIGQLKAVFSLDFGVDRETEAEQDGIADLWE